MLSSLIRTEYKYRPGHLNSLDVQAKPFKVKMNKKNTADKAKGPHKGAVIHHHDHAIKPVNFNTKNTKNNGVNKLRFIVIISPVNDLNNRVIQQSFFYQKQLTDKESNQD
jgi:hypothetical protein